MMAAAAGRRPAAGEGVEHAEPERGPGRGRDVIAPGRAIERRMDGATKGQIDELVTAAGAVVGRLADGGAAGSAGLVGGPVAGVRGGLTGRMVVGSGLLLVVVGVAFAVLLVSVAELRTATRLARHSQEVLVAANQLERLAIDLETGQRGFVITGQERFLGPWRAARVAVPGQASTLARRLAGGDLGARMPQRGAGEIGGLQRSFNTMAGSLQASRAELGRLADEQAALRRVATLVARGVPAAEVFAALAQEAGQPLPPDTQARIADFTELAATAIANTQARAELAASRARIVKAADQTRRRIERDLHDGIQQRLVSLALDLRATQASLPAQLGELHAQLDRVADGLSQALKVLARRCPLPVQADLKLQTRLPEPVEVAAYYVVAEALTNAAKHAHASLAHLAVQAHRDRLHLSVADDGVGGADPTRGSGLVGLSDRVQALGGTITVHSPTGQGTTLQIALPIDLKGD